MNQSSIRKLFLALGWMERCKCHCCKNLREYVIEAINDEDRS
jgi:hypothetical protein